MEVYKIDTAKYKDKLDRFKSQNGNVRIKIREGKIINFTPKGLLQL